MKAAGAERSLAGIAHQEVESEPGQRHDQKRNQDRVQPVVVGDQRHARKSNECGNRDTAILALLRVRRGVRAGAKSATSCGTY